MLRFVHRRSRRQRYPQPERRFLRESFALLRKRGSRRANKEIPERLRVPSRVLRRSRYRGWPLRLKQLDPLILSPYRFQLSGSVPRAVATGFHFCDHELGVVEARSLPLSVLTSFRTTQIG